MKYELKFDDNQELIDAMSKVADRSEETINKVLHSRGAERVTQSIIGFMPKSNRNKSNWKQNTKHAKTSNPLTSTGFNLGFRVYPKGGAAKNKGSFGYIKFPNDGRGPSNPTAQKFFERGLAQEEDYLMKIVLDALEEAAKL